MKNEIFLTRYNLQVAGCVAVILLIVSSFAFAGLCLESQAEIASRIQERVDRILASLVAYENSHGFPQLVSFVGAKGAWDEDDAVFVSIKDRNGDVIIHTSSEISARQAWQAENLSIHSARVGTGFSSNRFYVAAAPFSAGRLLVGQTDVKAFEKRTELLAAFVAVNGSVLALAFATWAFLSRRSRQRIDVMNTTLAAFSSGDIDRRIIFQGGTDALSELAYAINTSLDYSRNLIQTLNQTSTDIAHHLKKPMTRLRQRLELVSTGVLSQDEFKRKIEENIQDIDSLIAIFEALLNIGQLQSGNWRSRFVDVDLVALVSHVIDVYEPIISDHDLHLEAALPEGPIPAVQGDRELLLEMIVNFVENAIQYCPAGTTIRIGIDQVRGGTDIIIADNGAGVPPDEMRNLFQRFYRLETSRAKPGHGLGIPFAVAIGELHRAVVELCDNNPGLKVLIHFPARPVRVTPQAQLRMRSGYRVRHVRR